MCNLMMKKNDIIRYGYKVVAIDKKTGKHWSLAMGFCYDNHEYIPNVEKQNEISGYFYNGILNDKKGCYSPNMIGRTGIFEFLSDACYLLDAVKIHFDPELNYEEYTILFRPAVVACSVEEDIMSGDYGGKRVVAGRKLTIDKEITNY